MPSYICRIWSSISHFIFPISHLSLHSSHFTLHTSHFIVHTSHLKFRNSYFSFLIDFSTFHISFCILHAPQFTLRSSHTTLYLIWTLLTLSQFISSHLIISFHISCKFSWIISQYSYSIFHIPSLTPSGNIKINIIFINSKYHKQINLNKIIGGSCHLKCFN